MTIEDAPLAQDDLLGARDTTLQQRDPLPSVRPYINQTDGQLRMGRERTEQRGNVPTNQKPSWP